MKKQTLNYTEVDHAWYESAEKSNYAIRNNNSEYVPKKDRKKTFSVVSKISDKALFTGTRSACSNWIEKKTGKKVKFISQTTWDRIRK
jgi:hypothetical protein